MTERIEVIGIAGLPEIRPGDHLARLICNAVAGQRLGIRPRDLIVVSQKAVSKAEGAVARLAEVTASGKALDIAREVQKDPRLVELVLRQSRRIVRMAPGVMIVETLHGLVCANAGIDASNVGEEGLVTLLPQDPDASARRIRAVLETVAEGPLGVIISDSFNRPWREGSVNVAIGVSGFAPLRDSRGLPDDHGRLLRSTVVALADEVASAAQLVMGETGGVPAAVVRGVPWEPADTGSAALRRDPARDLFR